MQQSKNSHTIWRAGHVLATLFYWLNLFSPVAQSSETLKDSHPFSETSNCELNFGWMEWKPLQYIDKNNRPQGLQIELVREIASELGCNINFIKSDWKQLIQALKVGKIDFIPDATKNENRLKYANFSIPYRHDTFVIYVRTKNLEQYQQTNIQQLRHSDFKLSLSSNFLYGNEIEAWQKDTNTNQNLSYSENTQEHVHKLLSGKIDGFLEDPYVMAYNFRKHQIPQEMSRLPILVIGHSARFMFSKKTVSDKQVLKFNQALTKVKQLEKFRVNWFSLD